MPEPDSSSPGIVRVLLVLPLLAAWVTLLAVPGLALKLLGRSLFASFAPLGFLAVFLLPDRGLRTTRVLLVAFPAFLLATAAAVFVLGGRARDGALPGPSDLLLPLLAVVLGIVIALAWRRGPFALLLLPLKLAFLALLASVLAMVLAFSQSQSEPTVRAPGPVGADERRQLVARLQDLDPWAVAPGELRSERLEQAEVDRLEAWLLPRLIRPERAHVALALPADGSAEARVSLPLPFGRWLNAAASGQARVDRGRLELSRLRLRVGRFAIPASLSETFAAPLAAALNAERPLRPLFAAIQEARIERGAVVLRYSRASGPRGSVGELFEGPKTNEAPGGAAPGPTAGPSAAPTPPTSPRPKPAARPTPRPTAPRPTPRAAAPRPTPRPTVEQPPASGSPR